MNIKWLASALLCTGLAYCGGGSGGGGGSSGLPAGAVVSDLASGEKEQLCEYLASLQEMPEREIDCGNGTTVTVGINPAELDQEIADCAAELLIGAECQANVGEIEGCFEFIDGLSDAEFCEFIMSETPPAICEALGDPACNG